MKAVRDTKAGQSIAAWVIISPDNKYIAKVQAHYSDSGRVTVNKWNWGEGENFEEGSAGSYGYDKFTAAISHMTIDGHEITNHCAVSLDKPEGLNYFPRDFVPPAGYNLANYRSDVDGYNDCYKAAGLEYLTKLGYSIIQAI